MSYDIISSSPQERLFPQGQYDGSILDQDRKNLLFSYPDAALELFRTLSEERCESIRELPYNKLSLLLRFPNHALAFFDSGHGIDIEKVKNTAFESLSITLKGF